MCAHTYVNPKPRGKQQKKKTIKYSKKNLYLHVLMQKVINIKTLN